MEPRAPLPRFLRPCQSPQRSGTRAPAPVHALFTHRQPFGDAQVLWWPPTGTRGRDSTAIVPRTVLLFIPGTSPRPSIVVAVAHPPFPDVFYLFFPFRYPLRHRHRVIIAPCSGNPGLLDFYVPFLDAIHRGAVIPASKSDSDSESESLTIFAHAHLGLSSYVTARGDSASYDYYYPEPSSVALHAQVQAHAEFLDELLAAYSNCDVDSDSDSDPDGGGPA